MASRKEFSGPVQLLSKVLVDVQASQPLVALPPEPGVPTLLGPPWAKARYQYFDYTVYRLDRELPAPSSGAPELVFSTDFAPAEGSYDLAAIFLPKSAPLIEYVLSGVSRAVLPGARVLIAGTNKSAIRSSKSLVEQYIGPITASRSGSHSVVLTSRKTVDAQPFEGEQSFQVQAFGRELSVVTLPGTFSYGRLDEGTGFLLEHLAVPEFTRALDFGCGSGVLGTALQLAVPDGRVELVDSNVMALESARRTLRRNGLDPATVRPSDVLSGVQGTYDLIISNPPFHTGLTTDFQVTQELIETAGRHLAPSGRLVLVTNTFIDYFKYLRPCFGSVEVLAEDRQFRVTEARAPRLAAARSSSPPASPPRHRRSRPVRNARHRSRPTS